MTSGLNHILRNEELNKIKQVTLKSQTINIVMYFAGLQEKMSFAALLTVMQTLYQESMLEQKFGKWCSDIMNE